MGNKPEAESLMLHDLTSVCNLKCEQTFKLSWVSVAYNW